MADARRLRNLQMAFREAAYARYVAGNSVSLVGNWMQRTATGWLAWDLTGSSAWLGIVAFADLFPALLIGPVGGVLADRHDRRLLMLAFQSAMFAVAILLWLAAGAGMLGIHLLLVLTTLHGVLVGLNQPARLSLIPQLVRGDLIGPAIAINSMVFNGARFIGPAIAGLIIASFGTSWAFFVNALTYIPFLLALSTIRPIPDERHATRAPFLTQIAEGIRYVFDNQGIRGLFVLIVAGALLIRPLGELLPALADGVHGMGAAGLAMLSASLGLGAILGGLAVATMESEPGIPALLRWLTGAALAAIAVALAPNFALSLLFTALAGICLVGSGVNAQTMMQLAVPGELRGRVMSLFGITFRAAPAIGALALGALADAIGIRFALLCGAVAFMILPILRHGGLRRLIGR